MTIFLDFNLEALYLLGKIDVIIMSFKKIHKLKKYSQYFHYKLLLEGN